jgi:hypothetical protein
MDKIEKISLFINLAGCAVQRGLYVPKGYSAHKEGTTLVLETKFPAPSDGIGEVVEWELAPGTARRKEEEETARIKEAERQARIAARRAEIARINRENERAMDDWERARARWQRELEKWHESATIRCSSCKGQMRVIHSSCKGKGYWGKMSKCLSCKQTGYVDCSSCRGTGLKYQGKHDGSMPKEPQQPRMTPVPPEIYD